MPEGFLKQALRGFSPYVPGEQPPDDDAWVKLNTNESPLPPSPKVIEAIKAAAGDSLRLYPSPTAAPARAAIAAHFGLQPSMVAVGNGGDDLIEMCFRAFAGKGDRVAYPTPTYPLFEPLCAIHEAIASPHPTGEGWSWTKELAEDHARLKFIVNPNSPTGTWSPESAVEQVVATARGVVVLDEAYVDFAPESCIGLLKRHRNLLILRTFSKSYALAGMRIGFGLGDPELISALDAVKDSYNLDRLAIVAAVAAIGDDSHHRAIVDHVVAERAWLADELTGLRFDVAPSAANFLFVQPPQGSSAAAVADALRERQILIRHYDREPIAGCFRITIGTRDQHRQLLGALREILA
ncbi:MAG TPA: histidinol-phosphate transaminase [Candidatus Acidoferrum sp.]|jgi:histidinol-phosphate aminotransferase|nr:histidinol-phosphate transaminase [Candidatus Acidoferrum sp.]